MCKTTESMFLCVIDDSLLSMHLTDVAWPGKLCDVNVRLMTIMKINEACQINAL